ncbi:hypothetical protein NC653_030918 [Populus alba x Populus x berolinensis]|uniref:Uncharacterized protein n=1 Tax=Populus alba x Populus x berolinensis TaxID=444605 RepID=A0AAD6Q0Z2_9ROSI|nr:hypothetical protein NC653_030918 [Populus alba x Populus x berolinensis]
MRTTGKGKTRFNSSLNETVSPGHPLLELIKHSPPTSRRARILRHNTKDVQRASLFLTLRGVIACMQKSEFEGKIKGSHQEETKK